MSIVICPGCGHSGIDVPLTDIHPAYNASSACYNTYTHLQAYTFALGDEKFIHQLAVDAYGAQHTGPNLSALTAFFALAGLYLHFEKAYSGRQVQYAHQLLARQNKTWPQFMHSSIMSPKTVESVMKAPQKDRQDNIESWAASVWHAWEDHHTTIGALCDTYRTR